MLKLPAKTFIKGQQATKADKESYTLRSGILIISLLFAAPAFAATAKDEPRAKTLSTVKQQCQWHLKVPVPDSEFQTPPIEIPKFLDGKKIGDIQYTRYNVFSDDDSVSLNWLYQWLNGIHTVTKEKVIEQELSFKRGDSFSDVKVRESERLLRNQKFLYDARIEPVSLCNDTVDLRIATRDTWSITPAFNVSHNGDETKTRASITESNFLGTGKLISIARSKDDQRSEFAFIYRDPNVGGTHIQNELEISDNSDGHRHFIAINKPFYSFASVDSYGVSYLNEKREDPLYLNKDKLTDIGHELKHYSAYWGHSNGYHKDKTTRWRYGVSFVEDTFWKTENTTQLKPLNSRKSIYPWIEFNLLQDHYTTLTNFHSIKRTEDINLGRNFSASLGYSPSSWSDDESRYIFHVRSENAFKFDKELIAVSGSVSGHYLKDSSTTKNLSANFNGEYYHFSTSDRVFFAGVNYNLLKNPYIENQLFLGGDTGMRGYPVRFQTGDRNAVLKLEQRYYTDQYWWKLIRVAGAVFTDIGRSWGKQSPLANATSQKTPWLANIGAGLRLTPSRADANHVIHIDLAVPLTEREHADSVRFMVSVKNSF